MNIVMVSPSGQNVKTAGIVDYVSNGTLFVGAEVRCVMVTSADDLEELPEDYAPGTFAYVAGLGSMWQKDAAGEWVEVEV